MRTLLLLLAAVCAPAFAQGTDLSVSTPSDDPVFYRGECVRTDDTRDRGSDPCPRVSRLKGRTRKDIGGDRTIRHKIVFWNTGEPAAEDDIVLDQWPQVTRPNGWPTSYPVVLLFGTKKPDPPKDCTTTTDTKGPVKDEKICEPTVRKVPVYLDRVVPMPLYLNCPAGQTCQLAPDGGERGGCKKGEGDKGDGDDGKDNGTGCGGKRQVIKELEQIFVHETETNFVIGAGAGGAGALSGYALAKFLRRRRRNDDEEGDDPADAPAAPVLNVRVHPDRVGTQQVLAFSVRRAEPNPPAGGQP